jgi:signal transduction histidine kinase
VIRGRREGGVLIYEIEDNGRGIDPKDHERIFELFRRSGTQDQTGEGIGLAHVRALMYRLGGTISCDSELDRGATFRLSLQPDLSNDRP